MWTHSLRCKNEYKLAGSKSNYHVPRPSDFQSFSTATPLV